MSDSIKKSVEEIVERRILEAISSSPSKKVTIRQLWDMRCGMSRGIVKFVIRMENEGKVVLSSHEVSMSTEVSLPQN